MAGNRKRRRARTRKREEIYFTLGWGKQPGVKESQSSPTKILATLLIHIFDRRSTDPPRQKQIKRFKNPKSKAGTLAILYCIVTKLSYHIYIYIYIYLYPSV